MRVQDVMTEQVYKVSRDTTADIAWSIMRMRRIHHLVVTQDGRIVGLLSAHDFDGIRGRRARERYSVADLMTRQVVTASAATPVRKAAHVMRGRAISSLVVVDGKRIVGIVTAADLLDLIGRGLDLRTSSEAQDASTRSRTGQ